MRRHFALVLILIVLMLPYIAPANLSPYSAPSAIVERPQEAKEYSISTDYSVEVAADEDDDYWNHDDGHVTTSTWMRHRNTSGYKYRPQVRFQLDVPQGATIDSANFTAYETRDDADQDTQLYRIDETNVGPLESDTTPPVINNDTYVVVDTWDGSVDAWVTIDITTLVQNQVNLGGWLSGYYIGLAAKSQPATAHLCWEEFSEVTDNHAYINVSYTISGYTTDYVDQISNIDGIPDMGTHSSFSDQQYAPDSTYDTLTEYMAGGEWPVGYSHRVLHTLPQTAGLGSNYNVSIDVYRTDGYGWHNKAWVDYYLAQDDFDDIIFADDDKTTLLDYYLSSTTAATTLDYFNNITTNYMGILENSLCSVYHLGEYDRTYMAFMADLNHTKGGAGTPNVDEDIHIQYYDHNDDIWSDIFYVIDNPNEDSHGSPVIWVDNSGYIHLIYGAHNSDFKHVRSTYPEDVHSWTAMADIDVTRGTYPKLSFDSADNTVHLAYRSRSETTDQMFIRYISSSDGGTTWGTEKILIEGEWLDNSNHDIFYAGVNGYDNDNDTFHLAYTLANNNRSNNYWWVFYAYYNTTDGHMYNASSYDLGTTVEWQEQHSSCMVQDYTGAGSQVSAPYVRVDDAGIPHIIYVHIESGNPLEFVYWTGSSWSTEDITTNTGTDYAYDYIVHGADNITAYITDNDDDIDLWTWDGGSWTNELECYAGNFYYGACVGPYDTADTPPHDELAYVIANEATYGSGTPVRKTSYAFMLNGTNLKREYPAIGHFFVKVTDDISAGDVDIYVYYNNLNATSASQTLDTDDSQPNHGAWAAEETNTHNDFDLFTTDIDGVSDIGTESNPTYATATDPDSNSMSLQEEDTGEGVTGSDDPFDSEMSDIDSSADIGTETNPSYANDSVNSQYMNLQEANQGSGTASEWLDVNAFDATFEDWDNYYGASPYLGAQDHPTNYIRERQGELADIGWFDFPSTAGAGTLTVNVSIWGFSDDTDDGVIIFVDTSGGGGSNMGTLIVDQNTGSYKTLALGTYTAAEVNAMRIFLRTTDTVMDDIEIDHMRLGVSWAALDYELDFEYSWSAADYDESTEKVCIYVQTATQGGETLQAWEWTGSDWSFLEAIDADTWNNFTLSYLTGSSFYILINDTDQTDDTTQNNWNIDFIMLRTETGNVNYNMNTEYQWRHSDNDEVNEQLCIYVTGGESENLTVAEWNGASWSALGEINSTDNIWHNFTVSYLVNYTYTIRLQGDTETGDATQNTWTIDVIFLHAWTDEGIYRLELEEQWTSAVYDEANEYLCIKWGSTNAEQLNISVWYSSTWNYLGAVTASDANSWTNFSVSSYLVATTFTIKLHDNITDADVTQSTWQKDSCFLYTYPSGEQASPTNSQTPTCSNPDDTDNLYARYKEYQITTNSTDTNGFTDIDLVILKLWDNGRTTNYWTVQYDENGDTFAEVNGTTNIFLNTINSESDRSGNNVNLTWHIMIEWAHSDLTDIDLEVFTNDSQDNSDVDYYEVNFDIETRLDSEIGPLLDDGSGTSDRGRFNDSILAYGYIEYYGSGDDVAPPIDEIDVWVSATEYGPMVGPWEATNYQTDGYFSRLVYADDTIGLDTWTFKPVIEGAGSGGADLYHTTHTDTYITDRLNITIEADSESPTNGQQVNFTLTVEYDYDNTTCTTYFIQIARNATTWYVFTNSNKSLFNDTNTDAVYLFNATSDGIGVNETTHGLAASEYFITNTVTVTWSGGLETLLINEILDFFDSTTAAQTLALTINELIPMSDSVGTVMISVITILEIIGLAAAVSTQQTANVSILETIGFDSVVSTSVNLTTSINELIDLSSTTETAISQAVTINEVIELFDSVTTVLGGEYYVTVYELIDLSDTIETAISQAVTINDVIGLYDSILPAFGGYVTVLESLPLADTISTVLNGAVALNEVIDFSDSISTVLSGAVSIDELIDLSDTVATAISQAITINEVIELFDSVTTVLGGEYYVTVYELIDLSDTVATAISQSVTINEVIDLYDSILPSLGSYVTVSELLPFADSINTVLDADVNVLESIPLADTATTVFSAVVTISETIPFYDHVTAEIPIFSIVLYEIIPITSHVTVSGVPTEEDTGLFYQLFLSGEVWSYLGPLGLVIGGWIVTNKDRFIGVLWFIVECLVIGQYLVLVSATPAYWWHIYIILIGGLFTIVYPLWEGRR